MGGEPAGETFRPRPAVNAGGGGGISRRLEPSRSRSRGTARSCGRPLEEAFRIHALRWRGRRETSGFGTPIGMAFHRAAMLRLAVERRASARDAATQRTADCVLALPIARAHGVRRGDGVRSRVRTLLAGHGNASSARSSRPPTRAPSASSSSAPPLPTSGRSPIGSSRSTRESACRRRCAARSPSGCSSRGIRARRRIKRSETARRLYDRVPRPVRG